MGSFRSQESGIPPLVRAGHLFGPPGTRASRALGLNTLAAAPVFLGASRLDRIGAEVTTAAATSVVRLGVYADSSGVPGSLILDAGTIDASTTGIKVISIDLTLGQGSYWLAAVAQVAACSLRCLADGLGPADGGRVLVADNTFSAPYGLNGYTSATSVSGALPATFGAISQGNSTAPVVILRRV